MITLQQTILRSLVGTLIDDLLYSSGNRSGNARPAIVTTVIPKIMPRLSMEPKNMSDRMEINATRDIANAVVSPQ